MEGAAMEMPVRSMYVIMYITPMRRRTSQRVLVAREIAFCGRAVGRALGSRV
jgi:hypothetical protein